MHFPLNPLKHWVNLLAMAENAAQSLPAYGGQAVMEGVMMRGSKAVAVAVRDPHGKIQLDVQPLSPIYRGTIAKLPFVRGVLGIWDALGLGTRALLYSANIAAGEEAKLEGPVAYGTMAISLSFGIALFFLAPAGIAHWLGSLLSMPHWANNLLEGLVRLGLVIGYIALIRQMKDVKRLFGYHGAEHKTINAFEAGASLKPEIVQNYPIEHPRCGTAFLLMLVIFSVILFSFLGDLNVWQRLLSRLLLVPVLAGIAYEYLRITAIYFNNPLVKLLVMPNLALQHLTTCQPDLGMIEVAIHSFNAMRAAEEGKIQREADTEPLAT
ncbi:MAG TPA: DUF1385 domain-containing protein [Anaerolineales bacterium]|nr:DUF1385 domain-containing protein [Anaerolineales bacterium]